MKKLIFIFSCLLSNIGYAQLDRIRTDMNEQEFIVAVPEAQRDLDAEAAWVNEATTLNGTEGNSLWRIYNDTIETYRFNSVKAHGPSAIYPKADSSQVHKLRVSAQMVTAELESQFGKPGVFRTQNFTAIGEADQTPQPDAFLAMWQYGAYDYITVKVTTDLSSGNYINAPGKFTVVESQSYELVVEVRHRTPYTREKYNVGQDDDAFFAAHPGSHAQVKVNRNHIYKIEDTLTSDYSEWEFVFASGILMSFDYKLTAGTQYSSASDAAAYDLCRIKTEQLLKEGEKAFGKSTDLENQMKPTYEAPYRMIAYRNSWCTATWTTQRGNVYLEFEESGGGKSPATIFEVHVIFAKD